MLIDTYPLTKAVQLDRCPMNNKSQSLSNDPTNRRYTYQLEQQRQLLPYRYWTLRNPREKMNSM